MTATNVFILDLTSRFGHPNPPLLLDMMRMIIMTI